MAEEQQSKRALPVTQSSFESPFETAITRLGIAGLNLKDAIDAIDPNELTRMVNVTHRVDGGVTTRQGMHPISTSGGTDVHSMRLLDNIGLAESQTTVFGIDTNLYVGGEGALTNIDSGYSGDPISLVPFRPPLSGVPWMYIADSNKMSKVRGDGTVLPIGLPAPATKATVALSATESDVDHKKNIANFSSDGTAFGSWVATAGETFPNEGEDDSVVTATINPLVLAAGVSPPTGGGTAVTFSIAPGLGTGLTEGATHDFWNLFGVQVNRNLDKFSDNNHLATDDDYIHMWLRYNNTSDIKEIRLYFVVTSAFDPTKLPGSPQAITDKVWNSDYYWASFTPEDTSGALNAIRQIDATIITANDNPVNVTKTVVIPKAGIFTSTTPTRPEHTFIPALPAGPGSGAWNEFGAAGRPLRRGDFTRVGDDSTLNWSTFTGIIIYVVGSKGTPGAGIGFQLSDMYMRGGEGPDSGDATSTPYDYVYTHYDTWTGAEGNPETVTDDRGVTALVPSSGIDAVRQAIAVTPGEAYGNAHTIQRFYRRGGTLPTDFYFVGQNASDGGVFTDTISDTEAVAANTIELDNNQPVATVDSTGATILAQPINHIFGPVDGLLIGCGDPYRPGYIYFCKPGNAEAWPPQNFTEVCAPSERLLAGCTFGGQAYIFSQDQMYYLYPNLSGDVPGVTATPSQCRKGLVRNCRTGLVVGIGGILFIAIDGIYRTTGGMPEWLSEKIDPLFTMRIDETKNGMSAIDFDRPEDLHLAIYENELYFCYYDVNGISQILVYNLIYKFWRNYNSDLSFSTVYQIEGAEDDQLNFGSKTNGKVWAFGGPWDDNTVGAPPPMDDGNPIDCTVRSGAITFGRPREEKRLGDQIIDINPNGVTISIQNFYNHEADSDSVGSMPTASERSRMILDSFGDTPKRATNISTELTWSTTILARPIVFYFGTSSILEPDITTNRVTQWDDLQHGDEVYLTGITLDVDTGGGDRTVLFEVDFNGATSTAFTATVNTDGRHKVKFSWPAVQANKVRIRPADETCAFWILYRADWIWVNEPPRIAKWDSYFENGWDQYHTGLDLYCDTFGLDKTILVYADEVLIKTETINTNGRKVWHITLPWGRAHVYHFIATDSNPGLLYGHRWHLDPEPSEQTNWNQNFTVAGIESGKYLKALVFQCDTFGQDKTVTVECDGVVVETLTVNTNGRKVVEKSFPQHYGNVFRVYPTDSYNSRLYTLWWVFDEEPLSLTRWETQEIDHRIPAWHYPIYGHVTIRSSSDVNLQVIAYNQSGVTTTKNYTITSTGGVKQKCFVPFEAVKGILFKYILTAMNPFWLYREETAVMVRVWGTDQTINAHPFGNDDTDATRVMTKSEGAASRGGGGTGA